MLASAAHLERSGIRILRPTPAAAAALADVQTVIDAVFDRPLSDYVAMATPAYYEVVLEAQNRVNAGGFVARFVDAERDSLGMTLGPGEMSAQRITYLRAVRPAVHVGEDNVGFHRESFFSPDLARAFNIWVPLRGVTPENALQYVPESQTIPDPTSPRSTSARPTAGSPGSRPAIASACSMTRSGSSAVSTSAGPYASSFRSAATPCSTPI
jgi:hypothetical protein